MLHAIHRNSIAVHSPYMHQLLNVQIAEFPSILNGRQFSQLFIQQFSLVQPIPQVLLQEWRRATKGYVNTETAKQHLLVPFQLHISHKPLNPWPNSPASHMMIYSQLSAFQGQIEPFKDRLSTNRCLTSFTTVKAAWVNLSTNSYLPELLVTKCVLTAIV